MSIFKLLQPITLCRSACMIANFLLLTDFTARAGTVTTDPADENNVVIISQSDTVEFTASSTHDDYVHIDDSTYQNGTPSTSAGEGTGYAFVTFSSSALGISNKCVIKVTSQITSNNTNCSSDKPFTFYVDVVKVTFANVIRNGDATLPFSLPPSKITTVKATVTPVLPTTTSHKINISVDDGGSSSSGSATITVPSDGNIINTGNITIQGGTQTTPGSAGGLYLQAKIDGNDAKKAGRGDNGFSVAAWPCNFSTVYAMDIRQGDKVGIQVQNYWESDSGDIADLDQCQRTEKIVLVHQDNPPFKLVAPITTSTYMPGNAVPTLDNHTYSYSNISSGPAGEYLRSQVFLLWDARTGAKDVPCVNSGFNMVHQVSGSGKSWYVTASKYGSPVGGVASGSGSASSSNFPLP